MRDLIGSALTKERVSVVLCRITQMAALRVLTNSSWLKEDVLTAAAVWDAWDLLLTDYRFALVQEPSLLEKEWRNLARSFPPGRCAETDTYLAAFALAGGYRLLTFDRAFRLYDGLNVEIPE